VRKTLRTGAGVALALAISGAAMAAEAIRIAFIDPLSGPFASTGIQGLAQYEYAADTLVNAKGGVLGGRTFEIVPFDNKISPKESLIQLKVAIDQGIRLIAQGNSSSVANALSDAIRKHNRRNPDKQVLFLNYSAVDPALTNEKCSFWHFRFDANADIKMDALTDVIAKDPGLKRIYVIGQDYSFGKAVADAATRFLADKRPDIEIVGNELHPIGKVKDFTPYARKIIESDAQAIITGNWGADMVNLGKAVIQAGFDGPIYTYYAATDGITRTFGEDGVGRIRLVVEGALNPIASGRAQAYIDGFKAKHPATDIGQPRIANVVEMLARAIEEAGSVDDVAAVAAALEGMEHQSIWGSTIFMRPQDHQATQDIHIVRHDRVGNDYDNSGYGLLVESTVEMAAMDSRTTCKMERP